MRDYDDVAAILERLGLATIRLLTNNPRRLEALRGNGIDVDRVELVSEIDEYNRGELLEKQSKLGHLLGVTDTGA